MSKKDKKIIEGCIYKIEMEITRLAYLMPDTASGEYEGLKSALRAFENALKK